MSYGRPKVVWSDYSASYSAAGAASTLNNFWANRTRQPQSSGQQNLDVSALDEILHSAVDSRGQLSPRAQHRHSGSWRSAFLAKREQFARTDSQQQQQQQQHTSSVKHELLIARAPVASKPSSVVNGNASVDTLLLLLERSHSEQNVLTQPCTRSSAADWPAGARYESQSIRRSSSCSMTDLASPEPVVEGILKKALRSRQPSWKAWHTVLDAMVSEQERKKLSYEPPVGFQSLPRTYGAAVRKTVPNFSDLDQILTNLGQAPSRRPKDARLGRPAYVAQRIEQFERRPLAQQQPTSVYTVKSSTHDVNPRVWDTQHPSASVLHAGAKVHDDGGLPPSQATTNRPVVNRFVPVDLPRFHFPYGQPRKTKQSLDVGLRLAADIFKRYDGQADLDCMGEVAEALGLPYYIRQPLFSVCGGDSCEHVTFQNFEVLWRRISQTYHDEAALLVRILTKDTADYLLPLDLIAVVQDIIDNHPGLACLRDARAYHSTYLETVISRIFFDVSRHWSDRIGVGEVRRSRLLPALHKLGDDDDINNIRDYFSYEHFYVIYCTFWYLDDDHDLHITKSDLSQYNNRALSERIIDRIMSKAVNCNLSAAECKMAYSDFIWFLLAEEDKRHPKSVQYWFRCMDLDGDGYLSIYELEYFYEEQSARLEEIGVMAPAFTDVLCQMLDLIRPRQRDKITLSDLKRSSHAPFFFDTFFNREKYVMHEETEVNKAAEELDSETANDWDKFASHMYQRLLNVEGASSSPEHTEINCDTEEEEEEVAGEPTGQGQTYEQLVERVIAFTKRTV